MNEERIIEIETKLAFQDGSVQELNEVLCQQQQRIEKLEATCALLLEHLRELSDSAGPVSAGDERPPHY